jgi:hypothetical protein
VDQIAKTGGDGNNQSSRFLMPVTDFHNLQIDDRVGWVNLETTSVEGADDDDNGDHEKQKVLA